MKTPTPSHREAIALFRLGVIGDLLARDLARGELKQELLARSRTRYRPPGALVLGPARSRRSGRSAGTSAAASAVATPHRG